MVIAILKDSEQLAKSSVYDDHEPLFSCLIVLIR